VAGKRPAAVRGAAAMVRRLGRGQPRHIRPILAGEYDVPHADFPELFFCDVFFCDVFFDDEDFDDEDFDDEDFDDEDFDDEPVFDPLDLLRRSTLCCNASIKSITSPPASSSLSCDVVGETASESSLASISSRNCFWYSSPKASSSKSSERDS